MTYLELYTELTDLRFNTQTTKLAEVKKWVNAAEISLWNARDWVFKRVPATALAVVASNNKPTMPADYGKTRLLVDDNGDPLTYLDQQAFEQKWAAPTSAGRPYEFTVINRQIYLGPTPSASATFMHGYRRRYAHLNAGSAVTAGVMSVDTDKPLWDAEHHYVLVPWAMILGQKLENDPTAEGLRSERDELLAAMADELVGGVEAQAIQYG